MSSLHILSNIEEVKKNKYPKFTDKEYIRYQSQKNKSKFSTPEKEYDWAKNKIKKCSKCKKEKKLIDFSGNTSGSDGFDKDGYRLRRPECKKCQKEISKGKNEAKKIAEEKGISYKAPIGSKCGICKSEESKRNKLVFDHNHKNKTFRGYLCNNCNKSLGVFGDDINGLIKTINYLQIIEKEEIKQDPDTKFLYIPEKS